MTDNFCLKIVGGFIAAGLFLFLFGSLSLHGREYDYSNRYSSEKYLKELLSKNDSKVREIRRGVDMCLRDDYRDFIGRYDSHGGLSNITTKELKSLLGADDVVRRLRQHWEQSERKREIVRKYYPVGNFKDINVRALENEYFAQMTAEPFNPPYRCDSGVFTTYEQMRKKTEDEAIARYPLFVPGKKVSVNIPGRPPYSGILRIAQIDVKTGEVSKVIIGSHFLELSGMSREDVVSLFDSTVNKEYRTKYIDRDAICNVFNNEIRAKAVGMVCAKFASTIEENFRNHWYYRNNGNGHSWINVNDLFRESVTMMLTEARSSGQQIADMANVELEARKAERERIQREAAQAKENARELVEKESQMNADLKLVADFLEKERTNIILLQYGEEYQKFSERMKAVDEALNRLADIKAGYGRLFGAKLQDCAENIQEGNHDDLLRFCVNTQMLRSIFEKYKNEVKNYSSAEQEEIRDSLGPLGIKSGKKSEEIFSVILKDMVQYSYSRRRFRYFYLKIWPRFKKPLEAEVAAFVQAGEVAVPVEE